MHRFHRMHLSPEAALHTVETLDLEEKSKLAEGVAVLAVIDHRRDYLAAGYSCTLHYCMDRLHISQDKALRRIQVARVALKFPEVFEYLADGRLSLATASVLAPSLEPKSAAELLEAAAFRTRQEIVRLLTERSRSVAGRPAASEGEPLVQDSSGSYAPGHMNSLADLCSPSAGDSIAASPAPGQVNNPRRGRVTTTASGGYEVRLSLTDEEHQELRRAQDLLGHAEPSGDPALVYARAMKHYLALLEKQRLGVKHRVAAVVSNHEPQIEPASGSHAPAQVGEPHCGRSIPKRLRRLVWERDGARCAFLGAGGHRCEATRRLELDHITPVAQGGDNSPDNLRLLCRAHNQYEAERVFGKDHVERKREFEQRGRARARAAAEANARRAKVAAKAAATRAKVKAAALQGTGS